MSAQQPTALRSMARQFGLVAIAIILSAAAGASALVANTAYAPLAVWAVPVSMAIGLTVLFRPAVSLYLVVFVNFIPVGLIPLDLLSMFRNLVLLLAFGAWVVQAIGSGRQIKFPVPALLLASVILVHFVSLAWAPDLVLARSELVQWMIVLILFVLFLNMTDTPQTLAGLMTVLALAGWMLVLSGLYAISADGYHLGERLKVFDMNENGYGIALIVSLTGVVWVAIQPGPARHIRMAQCLAFIPLAALFTVFTGSRGGVLSFMVILGAFLLLRPTRPIGGYCIVLATIALLVIPGLFLSISNRLNNSDETAAGDRDLLWNASIDLIYDAPSGAGVGYGPFALHNYILRYTSNYAKRANLPSHNPILEIGIDTGFLGMALYCGLLASAVWSFVRQWLVLRRVRDKRWDSYFSVVAAVMIGYLFSWIKSGGVNNSELLMIQLALLVLPACTTMFEVRTCEQSTAGIQP